MKGNKNPVSLRKNLIQGTLSSLMLKVIQTCLSFILVIVVARILKVEEFGIYTYFFSIVNLLTVPAMLGGQPLLVREVATYNISHEFHFLKGLIRRMRQASGILSVFFCLSASSIGYLIYKGNPILHSFFIAMLLVPLFTVMNLQGAVLRGLHYLILGQINLILLPFLLLTMLGGMFFLKNTPIQLHDVMITYVVSVFAIVLATYILLSRLLPQEIHYTKSDYETSKWMRSLWPFLFISCMHLLNNEISILLLGFIKGPEAVGVFRIAQKGADLIPFGLHAVNVTIAPTVAELFAKGEVERLQYIIDKSIKAIALFSIPLALFLIISGSKLIPIVFGKAYSPAYPSLVILSLGQLFNACAGSVGVIMNMVGLERLVARGIAISAVTNIFLSTIFIFFWSVEGASIATALCIIIWNVLLALWLYRKTGLLSFFRFSVH